MNGEYNGSDPSIWCLSFYKYNGSGAHGSNAYDVVGDTQDEQHQGETDTFLNNAPMHSSTANMMNNSNNTMNKHMYDEEMQGRGSYTNTISSQQDL